MVIKPRTNNNKQLKPYNMTLTISIPNIVINISNTQNLNLEKMAHTIDELIAEVQESKTLAAGVKATIAGLRQKVADAIANAGSGTSDAELQAIQAKVDEAFAELAASNDDLTSALAENTDSGSTPVVTTPVGDTTPPVVSIPPADGGGTSTDPAPVDVTPTTPTDAPSAPSAPSTPTPDAPPAGVTVI